jgi:hypothetical protein
MSNTSFLSVGFQDKVGWTLWLHHLTSYQMDKLCKDEILTQVQTLHVVSITMYSMVCSGIYGNNNSASC